MDLETNKSVRGNTTIMRVDFDAVIGAYTKKMVAIYDSISITRDEVDKEIVAYPIGYDKRVVFMPKEQFETVFRSLLPGENSES